MEKLKALNKKLKLESIQLKNILKSSESISATSSGDKENDDMRFLKKPNSNLKNKTSQECNQQ